VTRLLLERGAALLSLPARVQQVDRLRRVGVLIAYRETDPEAQVFRIISVSIRCRSGSGDQKRQLSALSTVHCACACMFYAVSVFVSFHELSAIRRSD